MFFKYDQSQIVYYRTENFVFYILSLSLNFEKEEKMTRLREPFDEKYENKLPHRFMMSAKVSNVINTSHHYLCWSDDITVKHVRHLFRYLIT